MEATIECVECGQPLEPGAIVCKHCESRQSAPTKSGSTDIVEIRTRTRRAWGILFFGLLIFQPILQPANLAFALSTLSKAKSLSARNQSIETQLTIIIVCSTVFSVLAWVFVLHAFGVL